MDRDALLKELEGCRAEYRELVKRQRRGFDGLIALQNKHLNIIRLLSKDNERTKEEIHEAVCLAQWELDCFRWRGRVLTGKKGHWCFDWDELPVDETCDEWPCKCFKKEGT